MKSRIFVRIIPIAFFIVPSLGWAQITIDADPKIEQLISKKSTKQIAGYRLQICFDSDKSIVDEARNRFARMYPKIDTYLSFEAPNFNLMVGDFRTLIEAEKIQEAIFGQFTVVIIHKTMINLPRVD